MKASTRRLKRQIEVIEAKRIDSKPAQPAVEVLYLMCGDERPPPLTDDILATHFEAGTNFVRIFLDDKGIEDDYVLPENSIAAYKDTEHDVWRINFGVFPWLKPPEEFGVIEVELPSVFWG